MQERCSTGLGAPTSWVRRDECRDALIRARVLNPVPFRPDPQRCSSSARWPVTRGTTAAQDHGRSSSHGAGARGPVGFGCRWLDAGVAGIRHHGGSSRARKQTATTTLRPPGAPSPRSMVVVNALGSNAAAVGSIPYSAKPRPSKKARLNTPADEDVAANPKKTPDPEEANIDDMLNDPPPQDQDFITEQAEVDITGHADQPTSPIRTDKPASPAKDTDKPATPVRAAKEKDDDVLITGIGYRDPGNPVALSKHTAKEEFSAIGKGKWNTDLSTYAHLNAPDLHSGYLNRLYTSRDYEAGLVNMRKEKTEAELSKKESQTADLQENLKSQQAETSKVKEELTNTLGAMDKLKESFNKERADWEIEKIRFGGTGCKSRSRS